MEEKIQSIERVFIILERFKNHPNGVGLTELSNEVNLHKSTVHRFLNTLVSLGYVEQSEDNKYNLTYKLYNLGATKLQNTNLLNISQDALNKLSQKVNEVVHLVLADGIYVVYINKIEANNAITMGSKVGRRSFLVNTSVGKAMLSNYPNEQIRSIFYDSISSNFNLNLNRNFDSFMEEIDVIRKTKVAYDNEENEPGIFCIGTTIYGINGRVEGAISITGTAERMKEKISYGLKEDLLDTANLISSKMGYNNFKKN